MGKMTCIVCGVGFFSPDDSPKCGKCKEIDSSASGHDESSCGCGHKY